MARGRSRISTWQRCVEDLATRRNRFRLCRRSRSPWIQVREYEGSAVIRQFSSETFRIDSERDIEVLYRMCLEAHDKGAWPDISDTDQQQGLTWPMLAQQVTADVRKRLARYSSRCHMEGHLKTMAEFTGAVTAYRLEQWAREVDPSVNPATFMRRIETLSAIHSTGLLELKETIARCKALRPKGAEKKMHEQRTLKPRAIPSDLELQGWLDGLKGHEQWILALIATYGLRPSEAWHAEGIDQEGWITIPGEGLTKTNRHYAPPVPRAWVERYQLRENFERYQGEILKRWPIKWEERAGGIRIPVNNSRVANYLYRLHIPLRYHPKEEKRPPLIEPLWTQAATGTGRDWVRPYDLRHSYAIRCFTNSEVNLLPTEDHAAWMGHNLAIHKRIYLRWMPSDRQKAALQERHSRFNLKGPQEAQEAPSGVQDNDPIQNAANEPLSLSPEILAKLAKLEQLEQLLRA